MVEHEIVTWSVHVISLREAVIGTRGSLKFNMLDDLSYDQLIHNTFLDTKMALAWRYFFFFPVFTAPPVKTVVKERRPSSGGVKPVQQVFYTEWKNETGLLLVYEVE